MGGDGQWEGLGKSGVCDGAYEFVGSGGACGAGLKDAESNRCPSNSILDRKIRTLNANNDDDDDDDDDDDYDDGDGLF